MAKNTKRRKPAGKGKIVERVLGPAADEFGTEIAPLGKEAGHLTLRVGQLLIGGLRGSVYGVERVGNWVLEAVTKRLRDVPRENIVAPNVRIAAPAVQALVFSMGDESVREMFANLLAADMNSALKDQVHPSFVQIIKEMTSVDARIMTKFRHTVNFGAPMHWRDDKWEYAGGLLGSYFDPKSEPSVASVSLSNLQRLGLIEVYRESAQGRADKEPEKDWLDLKVRITPLGMVFLFICLGEKAGSVRVPLGPENYVG